MRAVQENAPHKPSPEVQPSQVTLKTVFTVSFGVLVVVALVMAVIHALVAITLTCAALLLAVALDHSVALLVRRGLKRPLAVATVSVSLLAVMAGLGFLLIPPAVDQGKALVQQAPGYIRTARGSPMFERLDRQFQLGDRIEELERKLPEMVEGAATPLLTALGGVLSFAGAAVTIFFLMVFMLVFGGRVIAAALDEARPERRQIYEAVLDKIYRSIGGYLAGLTLVCTVNASLTTTFLAINRVPFFLPLGILSGLSSMVPYAGPFVTGTFISLVSVVVGGAWHGLATAIYFVAYGQLEGNILAPLIFRRTVHVNPLIVTLSVLFMGEIAGVIGAIIAVPVVAALQIIARELLRVRRESLAAQRSGALEGS